MAVTFPVDSVEDINRMQREIPLKPALEDDTNHYGDMSLRGMHGFPFQSPANHCVQLIAAGGAYQRVDQSLGFLAHTVIVNNYTAQWFRVEAGNTYIPPSVIGMCIPLYQGSQQAKIVPETPVGQSSTITNGQICEVIYTAWQLPYSPGLTLSSGGGAGGAVTVTSGNITIVGALPAGANVIGHVITDTGSTTVVSSLTNALPAGANVIGHVIADTGSTTVVSSLTNALPAGTNAIGDVGMRQYTAPVSGERAGATSATQLANVPCHFAKIKAEYDNAGRVYVGISGVTKAAGSTTTTAGLQLSAGEDTGWLPIDNLNRMYIICDNAGDDVTYICIN